jgi:CHAP domain
MADDSRSSWHSIAQGEADPHGFIQIDTSKLTNSGSLLGEPSHANAHSAYPTNEFSAYLNQDAAYLGSADELFQNMHSQLGSWLKNSPTISGLHHDFDQVANITDEYRLQALEAGEHVLQEFRKDAVQIFENTNDTLSHKVKTFVAAHPELDDVKQKVSEVVEQVAGNVSGNLKSMAWKGLSTVYQGLKIAYNASDRMQQEFPDNWKHLTNVVEELALQGQEAIQNKVSVVVSGLQRKSDVAPTNSLPTLTPEAIVDRTSALVAQSATPQINTASFEADVIATAGAIVRAGAGQSFQDTGMRHLYKSKLKLDAWTTGEMVDYTNELGAKSDRWYRIAGTSGWISGAIIHTNVDSPMAVPRLSAPQVVADESFKGRIIAVQANVRSGAGSQFADVGDRFQGQIVEFDGRVKGEFIDYRSTLGTASDEWLRIKGTNGLISAALVSNDLTADLSASLSAPNIPKDLSDQGSVNWGSSAYREDNPLWQAGYAPSTFAPPNAQLGNAKGNCTWYVQGRIRELGHDGNIIRSLIGMAYDWDDEARAAGLEVSHKPQVGAIAQWENGHVAVVERVNSDGTVFISESSYAPGGKYDYLYNTRTISADSPSNYIIIPLANQIGAKKAPTQALPSESDIGADRHVANSNPNQSQVESNEGKDLKVSNSTPEPSHNQSIILPLSTSNTEYRDWIETGRLPKDFPGNTPANIPQINHVNRHYFENLDLDPQSGGSNTYVLGKPATAEEQLRLYREAIYKAIRVQDVIQSKPDSQGRVNFKVKLSDGNTWNINPQTGGGFYPQKGSNIIAFQTAADVRKLEAVIKDIKNGEKSFLEAMRNSKIGFDESGIKKQTPSNTLLKGLAELAKLKNFSQSDIVLASGHSVKPSEVTQNSSSANALEDAVKLKAAGRSFELIKLGAKWGGRLLFVISVANGAKEIYEAESTEEKVVKTGEVVSSIAGGFAGGAATAAALSVEENVVPVWGQIAYGATILAGGVAGAYGAGIAGREITQTVYNWVFKQPESLEISEEEDLSEDLPAALLPGEPGYLYSA